MHRHHLWFVAPVLFGSLSLAACGSSKNTPSAAPPGPTTAASSPAAPSSSAATPSAAGDGDFCHSTGPANPALAAAAAVNGDTAKLRRDIEAAVANAPGDIKRDVQTMADIELPILDGKVSQSQIQQQLSDPRLQQAMEHISAWSAAHCNG